MELIEFWTACSTNGIVLTHEQVQLFERYHKDLVYWNEKVNLISRKDTQNIFERHFLHSLSILKYYSPKEKAAVLDIGTGGGFPGIPLKIARQDLHCTLVDSIAKKVQTTSMFAKHLELRNISVIRSRVEELSLDASKKLQFDMITARAVAPLLSLVSWTLPYLKKDGKFVFLKGGNLQDEILELKRKYPQTSTEVIPIEMRGYPMFYDEEKKIVIVDFVR